MTKSPSPSVDEVAVTLSTFRNWRATWSASKQERELFDAIEASLVSPPKAGSGGPVAWQVEGGGSITTSRQVADTWVAMFGCKVIPLYANHEARGGGVRVTDEGIERAETAMRQFLRDRSMYDAGVMQFVGKELARAALEAALPPLGDGRAEIVEPVRYVTLGLGQWLSGTYLSDEMPSVCFGPAPEPKEPGSTPTEEVAQWATRNGAVVIRFANLKAAERMLDLVKEAVDLKAAALSLEQGEKP